MNTSAPNTGPLLYRIPEAAAALAMSRTVVYELIQRGDLQVVHIGASVRVTAASLRAFVERCAAAERLGAERDQR